jgi:hypothetical protein
MAREADFDARDPVLAHNSFYMGARGILKVQAVLLARGRYDELHAMIEKHGPQIGLETISGQRADTARECSLSGMRLLLAS